MRLNGGIIVEDKLTFGRTRFSGMRREVYNQNEDGTQGDILEKRTYDLKSDLQGQMIQVSIPGSVELKEFEYNAVVELVDPIADTVASATFRGADVEWYVNAQDIVLKKNSESINQDKNKFTNTNQSGQDKKQG